MGVSRSPYHPLLGGLGSPQYCPTNHSPRDAASPGVHRDTASPGIPRDRALAAAQEAASQLETVNRSPQPPHYDG